MRGRCSSSTRVPARLHNLILCLFVARIPIEVEEAARLDGASEPAMLRFVMVPLLRPAIASLFIVNFLASWNQFLLPTIFSTGTSTSPLVLGISPASETPTALGGVPPGGLRAARGGPRRGRGAGLPAPDSGWVDGGRGQRLMRCEDPERNRQAILRQEVDPWWCKASSTTM